MLRQLDISSSLTSKVENFFCERFISSNCQVKELSTRFELREGYALPDSPAGQIRGCELRTFLCADEDQDNSTHQRQATEYGGDRNSVMIFPGDMHWSHIHYSFAMSVIESLISEGQAAQNNQENSNQNRGFHIVSFRN
jgi:hypothetical protein